MSRLSTSALAILLTAAFSPWVAPAAPLSSPILEGQQPGWDEAPREFNEIQRRGFHDGIEGARRDMDNHRNPDVNNREEYRNADFPPQIREQYREAFRRGYMMAVSRSMPAPPPPIAQPPQRMPDRGFGWEPIPNRFGEIHRRGYQDGMTGAHRDMDNHRRPDPDNRDEYRSPNVPPQFQDDYREGFRRGYAEAYLQATGVPQGGPWDWIPEQFSEIEHQGFRDGIDGARKDADNHRRPDPNNRDEYRDPHVAPQFRDEYREGFRQGYERAIAHLTGY